MRKIADRVHLQSLFCGDTGHVMTSVESIVPAPAMPVPVPLFRRWYMFAILVIGPCLLFCGSIGTGLLNVDDVEYYFSNVMLHRGALAGLRDLWTAPFFCDYFPITQMTYWLDLAIGHGDSFVFARCQQLAWLGIGTLAVAQVIFRVSGRPGLAFAVALLYSLHPVTAESVLWLGERKNLVGFALAWWSFYHYITWRQELRARSAWFALIFCALALLAKVHAVMIPTVLSVYEIWYGTRPWPKRLVGVLPSVLLATAFMVFQIRVVRPDLVGVHSHSVIGGVFCDGAILLRYLAHVVVPQHLALFYQVIEDPGRWLVLSTCWVVMLMIVAMTCVVTRDRRLVSFAWAAAVMALMPALNLSYQEQTMSDHYLQWGLPFLLLIPCHLVDEAFQRSRPLEHKTPARFVLLGYAALLSLLAWTRNNEFSSLRNAAIVGVRHQPQCGINWAEYCFILTNNPFPSAANQEEAGRAGLLALRSADRGHIPAMTYVHCLVYGIPECEKTEGASAADALLAQTLPQANLVSVYVRGMILKQEGNEGRALTVLESDYLPYIREAAQSIVQQCRDGHRQPWDIPPIFDLSGLHSNDSLTRHVMQYHIDGLVQLADLYLKKGDIVSSFALSAILLNSQPSNHAAQVCYRACCQELNLEESVRRLDAELSASSLSDSAAADYLSR
jgi:hypothetical protein